MLVVTRKKDEKLIIGNDIEVQVLRIGRENVRLGIKAPSEVSIYRYEIFEAIQRREQAESGSSESPDSEIVPDAQSPDLEAAPAAETGDSPKARAKSEG